MQLIEDDIKKISQLLLSDDTASATLGYELVKQHKEYMPQLLHELVLIVMLHNDLELTRKVRAFLSYHYKSSGNYQEWKEQFAVFKKLKYHYFFDNKVTRLIEIHEKVRKDYQPFVEGNSLYSKQYYELARMLQYRFENHFDIAVIYYQIALKGNPNDHNAWFNLGHLYQNQIKETAKSEACYQKAIALKPDLSAAYNNIGVLCITEKNDLQTALNYYQKALDYSPSYDFYRCNLASTHLRLGNTEAFERLIQEVFSHDRYYYRAVNQWANYLWEYKKDYQAAEEEYREGLKHYPYDANLLGNLGEMYATVYQRYEEAYHWYKRALQEKPSMYRLTTMINLLVLRLKNQAKAVNYYKQLKELQREQGKDRDHDLSNEQWEDFLLAEEKLQVYLNTP